MTKIMTAALVALALVGGSFAIAPTTATAADVTVSVPGVAFGYDDGYWDQGHAWHGWATPDARVQFQTANHDHYYGWKHDRDSDMGWRGNDSWWSK
jgi:hypothetical protein